jgi:cytochrome o ubiquinol oxidase subunit 2
VWDYTHRLDPYKPIESAQPPLQIEAVAQDWKWLFIYPEENLAVVNELVIPSNRPISFRITSDTVMNAFYIPGLAGQIFAMAGMQTRLNLLADREDTYVGRNTQYSGSGFADQQFVVKVVPAGEYDAWLETARSSGTALDADTYKELAKPSEKAPVSYYSSVDPGLFDKIIESYMGPMAKRQRAALNEYAGENISGPSNGRKPEKGDL